MSTRPTVSNPARWAAIQLFATDVDGTLTDGGLSFSDDGVETKTFHVRDGYGIVQLHKAGVPVAWISGRESDVTSLRAKELKVTHLLQPVSDKAEALRLLASGLGIGLDQICYIGDDTNDLGAFAVAGIACAPSDAHPEVLAAVAHVTAAPGGRGAVRELCDLILAHRSKADR